MMKEHRLGAGGVVADDELVAGRLGTVLPATLMAALVGSLAVLALLATGTPAWLAAAALWLLAAAGVFLIIGLFTGHVRIGEPVSESRLVAAVAEAVRHGIRVCDRDGRLVYANDAYMRLVGRNGAGRLNTVEEACAVEPAAAEALYRLSRAASRGERAVEEICVRPVGRAAGEPGWYRISVEPFGVPETRGGGPLVLWQLEEVTHEWQRLAAERGAITAKLARYDAVPVGVFIVADDGTIEHMNATLARMLGLSAPPEPGAMRISDFVPDDGRAVLGAMAGGGSESHGRIDVDLVRVDGRSLMATLIADMRTHAAGQAWSVAVVERSVASPMPDARPAQQRSARLVQSAPIGIATLGPDGRILSANPAFSRLLLRAGSLQGADARELLARHADAESREQILTTIADALAGKAAIAPIAISVGEGREFTRRVLASALGSTGSQLETAMLCVIDATEQKALELKYAQAQKMEAVGKLAGGIAHDFNNVLTGIIGFSDLLVQTHRPGDPAYKNIMAIKSAADRAAGTVSQLLAFSRRQTLQPQVLMLNEVVTDLSILLNRLLGEKIKLKILQGRDLWAVKADKNQFEQVVINLAVNARDAMMPKGGQLTIRTRNITERDSQKLAGQGMPVGEYVLFEVEDTGSGMAPEIMAKIFEPFFTTKGILKGTGLGLSTVYGFVKQTGGFVFPESEVGKGTTFRVYLPAHQAAEGEEPAGRPQRAVAPADLTGTGRILVVEDEDFVRSFALEALRRQGYEIVTASTGLEGLEVFNAHQGRFDLVLTDVIMPEMDGPTLSKELLRRRPGIKLIFMSGYADDAFKNALDPDTDFDFLPKPFSLAQLAAKVKEVLSR